MNLKKSLENVKKRNVLVEVYGLGYIGFPLSIKLANSGFNVVGIDVDNKKIQRLKNKNLIDSELYLKEKFLKVQKQSLLSLSNKPQSSKFTKIGIIAVHTPIPTSKKLSSSNVKISVEKFLKKSNQGDMIIIESSIEVGTMEMIKKLIETKGFSVGKDLGLCYCPERIDPKNKKWKLHNIPRVIYCSDDLTYFIAKEVYKNINNAHLIRVSKTRVAEVVKSFENAFRLVNISLVNELALLCEALEINVNEVIHAASTKPFGFIPFYSSAGAGGHCIPKDPIFLVNSSKKFGFNFKTIESALAINSKIPIHIAKSIIKTLNKLNLKKSIIVCGLSYKENMDDMRDSPGFKIIRELIKQKCQVSGYDPYVRHKLIKNYLKQNNIRGSKFKILNSLEDSIIKNYSCLCVVQHHKLIEPRVRQIYQNSVIPIIYDCQNKIKLKSNSKSILKSLGN